MHHNAIHDALFEAARSAALAPTCEASEVVADSHSRPADIFLPIWCCGRPVALDIHIILSLQRLTLYAAASTPSLALNMGVQCKLVAHLADCHAAGIDFVLIVVETLGGLSEDSISTVWAIE